MRYASDGRPEVDLHGHAPAAALRRLAQELHAARVAGHPSLLVITGRGWGNPARQPILRGHVEAWLRGPAAAQLGVRGFDREAQGGALRVRLG